MTGNNAAAPPSGARKELVLITVEMAREWLDKSVGNRPIMDRQVDRLARVIAAGRWNPEASEIRRDVSDRTIDGHHRLRAIVKAGVPVWQWVALDCAPYTINDIDTGVPRTNKGQRVMRGEKNALAITGMLNAASAILLDGVFVHSLAEQDDLLGLIGDEIADASVRWTNLAKANRLASPAFLAGAMAVLVRTYPDAEPFAEQVVSANGGRGEPARELSRWLVQSHGRGGLAVRKEIAQRVGSAWSAWKRGDTRHYVRGSAALDGVAKMAREGWARPFVVAMRPSLTETT